MAFGVICFVLFSSSEFMNSISRELDADQVVGVSENEASFGTVLRGSMAVERLGDRLKATLEETGVDFKVNANKLNFTFHNNAGGFRGLID